MIFWIFVIFWIRWDFFDMILNIIVGISFVISFKALTGWSTHVSY